MSGSMPEPPIALVEVQGYIYDALIRMASLFRVLTTWLTLRFRVLVSSLELIMEVRSVMSRSKLVTERHFMDWRWRLCSRKVALERSL